MALVNALRNAKSLLTPQRSSESFQVDGFKKATESQLFPKVDPSIDGENCDHDCETCEVHLPKGFKIDEKEKLYGHVNGWATHILVATGKTDWVRDVTDEKGSVMEAVGNCKDPSNGKLMLSASNIPVPEASTSQLVQDRPTTVLLLPSFTFIDGVTPASTKDLIASYISPAPTNTSRLQRDGQVASVPDVTGDSNLTKALGALSVKQTSESPKTNFDTRPCPHKYLILLCSQRTRDVRCGQSAPLLRREFERHLRPLGLYRDLCDQRPGGVGIYFISHVGGHKFSANVMVYRKAEGEHSNGEASQCIWLARVRPEDCEGIIKFTVLQGKVVHPDRQLRGGFDRERGLVSW